MVRVLGIDPGSRITGYGVIEAFRGQLAFVTCGVIKTDSGAPFAHRINEIFEGINQIVQVYQPSVAAVEDVFVSKNPRSALKLGQARGAAVVAAMQNGLAVYDYSPKLVKQSVVGYGQAEKGQIQQMMKMLLNLPKQPSNDAADALAVAMCHANQACF